MARRTPTVKEWFSNVDATSPRRDLAELRAGAGAGLLNAQDEYGSTALSLCCSIGWVEGIEFLLECKADTELRYFRTGTTALHHAAAFDKRPVAMLLVAGGASPDARDYRGATPRKSKPSWFVDVDLRPVAPPAPHVQNTEHLAESQLANFKLPARGTRESLRPDDVVTLFVYGPKSDLKRDDFKVRIISRSGSVTRPRYVGSVETAVAETHLAPGTTTVEFGPENIAAVAKGQRSARAG